MTHLEDTTPAPAACCGPSRRGVLRGAAVAGAVSNGPATAPLAPHTVTVTNGKLVVTI